MTEWNVIHGDVLAVMKTMADNSCDGMLTDPPAGISFMNRNWDTDKGGRNNWIAWMTEVMAEAYRVLKPGAYGLVWAIPRTSHWMAMSLEDAGFFVKNVITHHFGSGMVKNHNVSKALDKKAGVTREVIGTQVLTGNAAVPLKDKGGTYGVSVGTVAPKAVAITAAATEEAEAVEGYGTDLAPGSEHWILVQKPYESTYAENFLKWGTGVLNVDDCRVYTDWSERSESWKASGHSAKPEADKIAAPPGTGINCHPDGRWAKNAIFSHAIECKPKGKAKVKGHKGYPNGPGGKSLQYSSDKRGADVRPNAWAGHADADGKETVQEWDCCESCPVAVLDEQSGELKTGALTEYTRGTTPPGYDLGMAKAGKPCAVGWNKPTETGTASRYFNVFHWTPEAESDARYVVDFTYKKKASTAERNMGCEHLPLRSAGEMVEREEDSDGIENGRAGAGRTGGARNHHATIKAIGLTKWLATMVQPPPRLDGKPRRLLNPFAGSGGEAIGAMMAGWEESVSIEMDAEFCEIARCRLRRWEQVPRHMDPNDVKPEKVDSLQVSLFGDP